MDHERRSGRRELFTGIGLLAAFGIWTMLIQLVELSVTGAAVFMMTRQPYAGILCLAILVVKGLLIGKGKVLS